MTIITSYLETMFSAYPQTPRLLEAKAELQTMMEDAYAGFVAEGASENEAVGRVITEFGNLDELAPVLGITGDLAHAPAAAVAPAVQAPHAPVPSHPPVTLDAAQGFAAVHERTSRRLAGAVALFVLAPIAIITLPTLAQAGMIPITENIAALLGLFLLFILVAVGVIVIIGISREFSPYTAIRDGSFSRNPVVTIWADDLAQQHDRARTTSMQIAILLWILSPAPVLLGSLIPQGSDPLGVWSTVGVAGLLIMVAAGLLVLIPRTWAATVANALGTPKKRAEDDDEHSLVGVIARVYWPLVTGVFLAWSFIGDAWDRSWIIWPIAGVLFGAVAAGSAAFDSYRKQSR